MDDATRKSLATRVGLDPETATEDEVNMKISDLAASAALAETDDPKLDDPEPDDKPAPAPAAAAVPVAASVVTIDAERLATLEANAAAGAAVAATHATGIRDSLLDGAIKAGKFSPARREHYATLYASDPEGTKQMIDGLSEGMIPLDARGSAGNGEEAAGAGAAEGLTGMDMQLDRDLANIRAGNIPGRTNRVMNAREA